MKTVHRLGRPSCFALVFAFFVVTCLPVQAQFDTATVLGTVRDSSSAVVPGASVTLSNVDTGISRTTPTDAAGNFEFVSVRIGTYQIKAELAGFTTAVTDNFRVTVNARQRVDVSLTPGQVTERVTVTGAAALLETDSSDRGQVIGSAQIVNLPLNGRAYADLALLSPGVRRSSLADSRDASFNVNGLRSIFNNFVLDGVDNNSYATSNQGFSNQIVQITPDALAEFKVQTNNYSAEYGRAGGAVVNAAVRSGTNQFRGSAWEFHRNDSLNAVGFFKPVGGQKPVLIRNQFGFTFGGPIRRDRTFFFADYEGFRQIQRTLRFASIPTMDQRQGILGASIRNPLTGEAFSNGVIPPDRITPFAKNVLALLPIPQFTGMSNNFQSLPRQTDYNDKADVKIDHQFSPSTSAFVRVSQRKANSFQPSALPLPLDGSSNGFVRALNQAMAVGVTRILSPHSLLDVHLGITRTLAGKDPPGLGNGIMQEWGIPGLPTDPHYAGGISYQSITGFATMGRQDTNPQFQNPLVFNPRVNYSIVARRHSLKLGYEYQAINTEVDDFAPKYGTNTYAGQFSRPTGGTANQAIYNLADFLFGARSSYALRNMFVANLRQRMHFWYLQDDFKVTSRLTLNMGVRYEFATPHWERDNHESNLDVATQSLVLAKAGSITDRSLIPLDRNNWAPRFGVAFNATPKWVFRGGYGISYVHFIRMGAANLLASNGPYNISYNITQQPSQGLCAAAADPTTCFRPMAMGFPEGYLTPERYNTRLATVTYYPSDYRTGYVQSWHFTIQRQILPGLLLDVAYVGNHGVKLQTRGDYNQARPNGPSENLPLLDRRPLTKLGPVEYTFSGGFDTYNGLQAKLERRLSRGLYLLNSFTWSKVIDNSGGGQENSGGDSSAVNVRNIRADKGLSNYNQPFNNTTTFILDIPYGKGRRFGASAPGLLEALLGGWRLTGINTAASGMTMNLTYTPSSTFTVSGTPAYRVNVTGDPMLPKSQRTIDNYFDRSKVSIPTDRTQPFGNAGRNIARGYPMHQLDLGLHKGFALPRESTRLEFRAEFFNFLNKTNFGLATNNLSSVAFGTISSTFVARQVQLGLKLYF